MIHSDLETVLGSFYSTFMLPKKQPIDYTNEIDLKKDIKQKAQDNLTEDLKELA